jgi:hypothetical protein
VPIGPRFAVRGYGRTGGVSPQTVSQHTANPLDIEGNVTGVEKVCTVGNGTLVTVEALRICGESQILVDTVFYCVKVCNMVRQKKATASGVRFTADDQKLLEALQKKTGINAVSEVLRMALRALAEKQGVSV